MTTRYRVTCPLCGTGAPIARQGEALDLATVHNHLHHKDCPTARVRVTVEA